jgi:hypothetical protein
MLDSELLPAGASCMFERCWSDESRPVVIEGVRRDLCAVHEATLRSILESDASSMEVVWGASAEEEAAEVEAWIAVLIQRFGDPPPDYLRRAGRPAVVDAASTQPDETVSRGWDAIELARDEVAVIRERTRQEPVVRVRPKP